MQDIIVKISGREHLWGWDKFRELINGKIIDYDTNENIINSITYSVPCVPSEKLLKEWNFQCEVLSSPKEELNKEDIGFGFKAGINNITITKVENWIHGRVKNWYAFLWYISQYVIIVDYGANWFKVKLFTSKQRQFFYEKVRDYCSDIWEDNYKIDKENDLWLDHNRNAEVNKEILLRLINEK